MTKKIDSKTKQEICELYKKISNKNYIARQFNVDVKTVLNIIRSENIINQDSINKKLCYDELNMKVLQYYNSLKEQNTINSKTLVVFAREQSKILNIKNFNTKRWYNLFIKKFKIDLDNKIDNSENQIQKNNLLCKWNLEKINELIQKNISCNNNVLTK